MKLLRFGEIGKERPGLLHTDGTIRDLSTHVEDLTPDTATIERLAELSALDPGALPIVEGTPRIGSCISRVPNFYGIGLNYAQHARESGLDLPGEPLVFSKASSALNGPYDPIPLPRGSVAMDWEVELGVIIGREASYVSEAEALDCVAGYCTFNDVSERDFQIRRGGQWVKGKSAPGFAPMGPWFVTADEIANPQALALRTKVNGVVMQDNSTSDMVFGVATVISYLSEFTKLVPGDVIATGTPEGVAMGRKPPNYLRAGDVVEVEVEGLGKQRLDVVAWPG